MFPRSGKLPQAAIWEQNQKILRLIFIELNRHIVAKLLDIDYYPEIQDGGRECKFFSRTKEKL